MKIKKKKKTTVSGFSSLSLLSPAEGSLNFFFGGAAAMI